MNVTIDSTAPVVSFVNGSDLNGSVVRRQYVLLNVSVFDNLNVSNVSVGGFLLNGSSIFSNVSSGSRLLNVSGLSDGRFVFNASVFDSAGNVGRNGSLFVSVDVSAPNVSNVSIYPAMVFDSDVVINCSGVS